MRKRVVPRTYAHTPPRDVGTGPALSPPARVVHWEAGPAEFAVSRGSLCNSLEGPHGDGEGLPSAIASPATSPTSRIPRTMLDLMGTFLMEELFDWIQGGWVLPAVRRGSI